MNPLSWLDDRIADASDAALDFLWAWLGVSRSTVAKALILAATTVDLLNYLPRREYFEVFISGLVFVGCFFRASLLSKFGWDKQLRIVMVWITAATVATEAACRVFGIASPRSFYQVAGCVLFTLYLYAIHTRGGGKQKRARRSSISELAKLFGTEWIPRPAKEGC